MTFTLTIELGNDAMQNQYDVRRALRELASDKLINKWSDGGAKIMDANGNSVGQWEVK